MSADLIARLETVEAGSRELDEAVFLEVEGHPPGTRYWAEIPDNEWVGGLNVTASVDAALALCREHWGPMYGLAYNGAGYTAEMQARPTFVSRATTEPLALVAALLRALYEEPEG